MNIQKPCLHALAVLCLSPTAITGGAWENTDLAVSYGATFATAKGGPSDKLFIPLSSILSPGTFPEITALNDVLVNVFCGDGSQPGITFTLRLTFDSGQTAGPPITTGACPTTAPVSIGVGTSWSPGGNKK